MGATRLFALAWALLVLAPRPAAAQAIDDLIGRTVVSVSVVADGRDVTEPSVRSLLDTRVGQPLDMRDVRRALRAMAALERFDDLTVEATATPSGVALRYLGSRVRRIGAVGFQGDLGVKAGTLRDALTERFGRHPSPRRAAEMSGALAATLVEEGFLDATVSSRVVPAGDEEAELVFDVKAGPRFRIGGAAVDGAHPDGGPSLLERLRAGAGRAWRPADMARRVDREVERLREDGRYEARLSVTPLRRAGEPVVDLRVEVDAGPSIDIAFEGDPLPKSRIAELVPVRREGSVDEDLLEDSRRRIERFLRDDGYWRSAVEYRRTEDQRRLRVVFDVRRGPAFEVGRVEVTGARAVPVADVAALVLSRAGRPFVESTLDADVAAITQLYRVRGHAQARVTRTIAEQPPASPEAPHRVDIGIAIDEGVPTRVGSITLRGRAAVDEPTLRQAMQLRPDGPFFGPQLEADRNAVQLVYLNRGYPDAAVRADVQPVAGADAVDVVFEIDEGLPAVVDHVVVTGQSRTSVRTILREAQVERGRPVGLADLEAAQRRISALGLFRRVRIDTLRDAATGLVDVVIAVEENAATTIGYGGGIEGGRRLRAADDTGSAVERFEFAPRGFFEVGRRNLWGKNRSVNLFSRASLRQAPGSAEDPDPGGLGLHEYRVIASFREPRAFGWTADATVSALVEQAIRSSFSYRRRSLNADLTRRIGRGLTVIARYAYGYTDVFEERYSPEDEPLIDRLFPQVTLSTVGGVAAWDTRDDPIDPTRGMLVGLEGDVAARALGSEVGYVKSFAQGFLYRRLPSTRLVVAGGLRLGLATGFPRPVARLDESGQPVLDADGQPIEDIVRDLPSSERFYAGGDTTVRGFTLDRLGDARTIDAGGFPTGGDAVIIANAELRFPVTRTLGGVVFLDAGNVFARVQQLDLGKIRGAAGFGLRYKSPIGPLRVDLGFKLDPRELGNGQRERGYALHISIGQAF